MPVRAEKRHAFTGHSGAIYALSEGFRAEQILSGSSDCILAGWDVAELKTDGFAAKFPSPVYSIFLLNNELLLAGTGAGKLHFLDLSKKEETKILQLHKAQLFDIAFSPKHELLFTAGGDGSLCVLDVNNFSLLGSKQLCKEKLRNLALSPDQSQLAVACGDGKLRIFSLPRMEETHAFVAHQLSANSVCWHPDGNYLLSGGRDAHLNAWDAKENFAPLISIPAHNYAIYSIVFDPTKKYFATASRDKTVKLWDAEKINFLLRIDQAQSGGHVNSVNRLLWNQYGLFSAGDDRSIIAWDISIDD